MKNYCTPLLAIIALFVSSNCLALNLPQFCKAKAQLTEDQFLEQFPYEDVIRDNLTHPLEDMLTTRSTLIAEGRSSIADNVLYETCEFYLKSQPIDASNLEALKAKLLIAEQFLQFQSPTDSSLDFITHAIGDRFFGAAAYRLEEGFASGIVDKESAAFAQVLEVLSRNKYNPNIPATNAEKLWDHVNKGDWAYIWDRFKTRYLKDTILVFSLALNLLFFLKPLLRLLRKKRVPATERFHSLNQVS